MTRPQINCRTLWFLMLGFGGAGVIYLLATPVAVDPLLGDPLDNKKYVHELALYGGKANVLSADFMDWFSSIWHGRNLAFTVAVLTIGAILLFRFIALHPDNLTVESASGRDPGKTTLTVKDLGETENSSAPRE